MADVADVLTGIVDAIGAAMYPNGTAQASATGSATRIYPGWPTKSRLDVDLKQNIVHVTAYPLPTEKIEAITAGDAVEMSVAAAGVTLTVNGNQITVGGTPKVGDVPAINWNRQVYAYAVVANDTTATVAGALAALFGATAVGSVITAPAGTFVLSATVSTPGTVLTPMRRITRNVQVTTWASTPTARDATAKLVDAALWNAERVSMSDGTQCGLSYASSPINDMLQKDLLYRRDIIVQASFVSSQTNTAQTVADLELNISNQAVSAVTFNIGP